MAKRNPLYFLIIGLVCVFFLLIMSSGQDYLPYDNVLHNYANYESFSGVEKSNRAVNSNMENFEPIVETSKTVSEVGSSSELIDKFGQVTKNGIDGVDGCVSSGLSNAGGYMCLTPELIELLKTRGGNATGYV